MTIDRSAARNALPEEPAHDVGQDAAVTEVLHLGRRVDPDPRRELDVARADAHRARGAAIDAPERDRRLAGEPERGGALAVRELEQQDAHADQVGPVDALEGPRD